MIKGLLCDIDGTLVQSNWLHAEAWQVALGGMGVHLELEALRKQIGKGGDELIPVFVPWWKQEIVAEPLKAFRKHIFQHDLRHRVTALPDVRPLFQRVQAAGIKIALASSSDQDDLELLKRVAGVDDLIDAETSAADTKRAKPHPDIFSVAVKKLGFKPSECLALGDTPYDAESAGRAGVRTIGVTTGGWSKQELLDAGCIEAYDGAAELLREFDRSALVRFGLH